MHDVGKEIELACKNLPEGWVLSLHMEKGAAWLELTETDGESMTWVEDEMGIDPHDPLWHRINFAVDFPTYHKQFEKE